MKYYRTQYLLPAVICAIIVFVFSASAAAGVIYVKWNTTGTPDGKSWDTAFLKVKEGLNAASSGDEVWVAAGTYTENITVKDGVALYGGFAGVETSLDRRDWKANETIVDGGGSTVVRAQGCSSPNTAVDGFTTRNGIGVSCNCVLSVRNCAIQTQGYTGIVAAMYSSIRVSGCTVTAINSVGISVSTATCGITGSVLDGCATGMLITKSACTITDNTVRNSTNGGISAYWCSGLITGNTVEDNYAKTNGGGIYCKSLSTPQLTIEGNTIRRNVAATGGGGIYCEDGSPVISRNLIDGNVALAMAGGGGGGIACYQCSTVIRGNRVSGNMVLRGDGGGIWCKTGTYVIQGNTITGNSTTEYWDVTMGGMHFGGGLYLEESSAPAARSVVANNVVAGNRSDYRVGGVFCWANTLLANNTIVGNYATDDQWGDVGCGGQVSNNVIAYNSHGITQGNADLSNNNVYANEHFNYEDADQTGLNGNICADPKFADMYYGNFHVAADSPCLDAGDDSVVAGDWTDMDGQPRIQGSHVDIGADESDGTTWTSGPNAVIRVTPNGSDANDGSAWDNGHAMRTVQAALDAAEAKSGEVWVAAGTYPERVLLSGYSYLYGGFRGTETGLDQRDWSKNTCILDGQRKGSVVTIQSGRAMARVDGFTIENGWLPTRPRSRLPVGAGVQCTGTGAIAHNTVIGNECSGLYGGSGGILAARADVFISENTISGNKISGGMASAVGCYSGSPVISHNWIVGNSGSSAVCLMGSQDAHVVNNLMAGNEMDGVDCIDSVVRIAYNTVIGGASSLSNSTGIFGSGSLEVVGNIAAQFSTGIYLVVNAGYSTGMVLHNNAFGNVEANYRFGPDPEPAQFVGNISADPLFVDMVGGDYRLRWDSPCVDAGTNEGAPLWDILGNPRPIDGNLDGSAITDMGAFEYAPVRAALDIVPGDPSNTIPPQKNGMVTVAILGTSAFDVSSISPTSIVFGPGKAAEAHGRGHLQDVNMDGRMDLLLHFRCQDIGLLPGASTVSITGRLLSGEPFTGSDSVIVKGR